MLSDGKYKEEDLDDEEYLEGLTIKEREAHEKYKRWLEEESDAEDGNYKSESESEDECSEVKNPKVTVTGRSLRICNTFQSTREALRFYSFFILIDILQKRRMVGKSKQKPDLLSACMESSGVSSTMDGAQAGEGSETAVVDY